METLSKNDTRLFWIVKVLLGACLVVPLFISANLIFPYTTIKVLVFRVLVELAAAAYLYLALKYKSFRPGKNAIFLAVLLFLGTNILAAIFGIDFMQSFWGDLERGGGIWGLLHFAAWFFMLATVFKNKEDGHLLVKISVGAATVVSLSALIQRLGGLGDLFPPVDRVYGTLGNAGILGSYLVFNVFLAGYLVFVSWQKKNSFLSLSFIVYCLLLIVNCVALLFSGTRGAWVGIAIGIVVGLGWAIFFGDKRIKKYSAIILAVVVVLAGVLFFAKDNPVVKNAPVLSRLANLSLADSTIKSRLLLWQEAWPAWQARPIFGYGPENFETAVGKHLSPDIFRSEAYGFDRAHNFIFDYGLTSGWLGLLAYLAIFGAALWKLAKQEFGLELAVLAGLLVAYLAQNFFIFDSFASYLMLFFILAIINNNRHPEQSKGSLNLAKKIVLTIFAVFTIFSLYSFNLKPLLAAHYAERILSLPASEAEQAGSLLEEVIALKAFALPEVAYQVSLDYIDKIGQNPALAQNEKFYDLASGALNELVARFPGRVKNYIALSWFDLYFSGFNSQRVEEAISLGNKIKEMSPNKKDAYFILVASYALIVQPQKAQEVISQAEKIDAKIGEEVKNYYDKLK